MKKLLSLLLAALLVTAFSCAWAEEFSFADLAGQPFECMSGVGGWGVELHIAEDGSFSGLYHDSEYGESGEGYPGGTVYGCIFHGKFSAAEEAGVRTLVVDEAAPDEGQVAEAVEENVRYVTAGVPDFLKPGAVLTLYRPGTAVSALPEGFLFWAHIGIAEPVPETLACWGLYNEAADFGFISAPVEDAAP